MGMDLTSYYHVYAVNDWPRIVHAHLDALEESGLGSQLSGFFLGVVGRPAERRRVLHEVSARVPVKVVAEADQGWEQVTLNALWRAPKAPRGAVLYAHTKGVSKSPPSDLREAWRRSMTQAVVIGWRRCVDLLQDHDLVGCHWLTPERWSHVPNFGDKPYFAGNFWWATTDWLRGLPKPTGGSKGRWDAEPWVGSGPVPRVVDLAPGWPGPDTFVTASGGDGG